VRKLFFLAARWNVVLAGTHILGVDNGAADALSQNNLSSFQGLAPGVKEPVQIPGPLLKALVQGQSDWTTMSWTALFTGFFLKGLGD